MPSLNVRPETTNNPRAACSRGPFGRFCAIHQQPIPSAATVQTIQNPIMRGMVARGR